MKCTTCKHYTAMGEMCDEVLDIIEPGEIDCWGYEAATNADRIRAMSDEELLKFIKKTVGNAEVCRILKTEPKFLTLDWLQQPADEDA